MRDRQVRSLDMETEAEMVNLWPTTAWDCWCSGFLAVAVIKYYDRKQHRGGKGLLGS